MSIDRARLNGAIRASVFLLVALIVAVMLGEAPRVLAACCAPEGATGLGTAWFVNDFAQYESAIRQGAEQTGWLIHDPFTAEPHSAAFMFPLYVGIGKLSAVSGLPAMALERVVELLARLVLVLAVWRFCLRFASGKHAGRWAFGLALFAGGLELFAAPLGGYTGNWSYELNGFGLLFAAPHVPLAMAATLELAATSLADMPPRATPRSLLRVALLSAIVTLLHPFHVPVLLAAMGLAGLVGWAGGQGLMRLAAPAIAGLAALPVLLPTIATFGFDPFWMSTYSAQNVLPSPAPHELIVDLGPTLVLALLGAALLRAGVAPFGLVLWILLALIAMYLPVPYQRRLSFGIEPSMAVLAANGLAALTARAGARWARTARLATVALSASGTILVLVSVLASSVRNTPLPVYRSTADLDAAADWLNTRASPADVILADWEASNYLAARTPARVVGGHPVATLHPDQKQFEIASVFAHASSLVVARALGAQWVVYGPAEAGLRGPSMPAAFQSGAVRVYRVSG